jgi:hypothetical protein
VPNDRASGATGKAAIRNQSHAGVQVGVRGNGFGQGILLGQACSRRKL